MSATKISYGQAIGESIRMEMDRDPSVVCVGTDISHPNRSSATDGLLQRFGPDRVVDLGATGTSTMAAALGMAARGLRVVCEARPAELADGGLAIAGEATVDGTSTIVIRVPSGGPEPGVAGIPAGIEAWLLDAPGMDVVTPSTPADMKGMLTAAIRGEGAVCVLEAEDLYREVGDVPEGGHEIPLGSASVLALGTALTVVAYGLGAALATEFLAREKPPVELVDLRSLRPIDRIAIAQAAGRTGKLLVLEPEGSTRVSAEVASILMADAFEYLDGPLQRVALHRDAGHDDDARAETLATISEVIGELSAY